MNVSSSKIGHDFSIKVDTRKKVFNKHSPKFIFTNEKNNKNSIDFSQQKLTLKVQFWHFLSNCNLDLSTEFFISFFFENVDPLPKVLIFRTNHL